MSGSCIKKNIFFQVFTHIETSIFTFSLFCTSETCFSNLIFVHLLVVTIKKFVYSRANTYFLKKIILAFFHPNRDFKSLFFTFFIHQRLVFIIRFLPAQRNFICAYLSIIYKKNYLLWEEHAFYEKNNHSVF